MSEQLLLSEDNSRPVESGVEQNEVIANGASELASVALSNTVEAPKDNPAEIDRLKQELYALQNDPSGIRRSQEAFEDRKRVLADRTILDNPAARSAIQSSQMDSAARQQKITDLQNRIYRLEHPEYFPDQPK